MYISRKEKSNLTDYIKALRLELQIRYETIEGLERYKIRFGKHRRGNVERLDNLKSSIPLFKALIEDLEQVNNSMKMGLINQF
jgi:hypothetical protein